LGQKEGARNGNKVKYKPNYANLSKNSKNCFIFSVLPITLYDKFKLYRMHGSPQKISRWERKFFSGGLFGKTLRVQRLGSGSKHQQRGYCGWRPHCLKIFHFFVKTTHFYA